METPVYTPDDSILVKSATCDAWFRSLHDARAKARIAARLDRVANGNLVEVKPVNHGISELRIDYEPGYRDSAKAAKGTKAINSA